MDYPELKKKLFIFRLSSMAVVCLCFFFLLFFIVNPWKYHNITCAKKTRTRLIEFDPFVQSVLYWIPVYEHWKQVFSLPMFDKFVQWKEGSADCSQAIYVLWMWFIDKWNNWGWLEISQYVPRLDKTKHLFCL